MHFLKMLRSNHIFCGLKLFLHSHFIISFSFANVNWLLSLFFSFPVQGMSGKYNIFTTGNVGNDLKNCLKCSRKKLHGIILSKKFHFDHYKYN